MKKNFVMICMLALCSTALVSLVIADDKVAVSAAVESAIKALFPKAAIEKSQMEKESVEIYEVKLNDAGKKTKVTVASDGTVADIETVEDVNTLPAAVKNAIVADSGMIKKAEKRVANAALKYVKLDKPQTTYEIAMVKDGKEIEVKLSAEGKILNQKAEADEEKEDKDKHEEGEEND